MRNSKNHSIANAVKTLLALSVFVQTLLAASANDNIALLSETPRTDAAPISRGKETALSTSSPVPAPAPMFLYGRVKQRNKQLDGIVVDATAGVNLQAESPAETSFRLRAAAYKKLSQGF